jgi:hypothetical protein
MHAPENSTPVPVTKPVKTENSYFGNPYQLHYEQYGLENLDRNSSNADEIQRVVILGYN